MSDLRPVAAFACGISPPLLLAGDGWGEGALVGTAEPDEVAACLPSPDAFRASTSPGGGGSADPASLDSITATTLPSDRVSPTLTFNSLTAPPSSPCPIRA